MSKYRCTAGQGARAGLLVIVGILYSIELQKDPWLFLHPVLNLG